MSGPASERVQNSGLEEMVFTDSIPYANRCSKSEATDHCRYVC